MIAVVAAVVMHWLVLSDVHMNPFDPSQTVPYGEDTNRWLLDASIEEMKKDVPDPSVVIVDGDMLAHHFPARARDAKKDPYAAGRDTIETIATALNRAYPHAQFVFAMGNNDDPCGDYRSEVGGRYIGEVARILEPMVNRHGAAPGFLREFERGAYYTVALPNGMRGVVLNSVLWSFVFRGSCQVRTGDAPAAEMQWVSSLLGSGENVVMMHMPLGFDPESTSDTHRVLAVPFLSTRYDGEMRSLFSKDRNHVAFAIAGHTHRYDFRDPGGVPMLIVSSISPIYRNGAAFYRLDVEGHELRDVEPFAYDVERDTWVRRPSFDKMYGTTSFSGADLNKVSARIAGDPQLRAQWLAAYDVWSPRMHDVTAYHWQTFVCAQHAFGSAFGACAGTTKRSMTAIFVAGAGIAIVVFGIVLLVRRRRVTRLS